MPLLLQAVLSRSFYYDMLARSKASRLTSFGDGPEIFTPAQTKVDSDKGALTGFFCSLFLLTLPLQRLKPAYFKDRVPI
jgi:hypothetical protein